MKRTIFMACIIVLIAAIMVMPTAAFEPGECDIFVHDGDSIKDKVSSASEGQTVCVYNGTYGPYFIIDKKNIRVIGEGADVVTLHCDGTHGIEIGTSYNSSGAVVDGFTVVNSPTGITVAYYAPAPNGIIRNCVFDGMTAYPKTEADNTTFENNVFTNFSGAGSCYCVLYIRSNACTVVNNTFINNAPESRVLTLRYLDCTVANNTFVNNTVAAIRIYKTTAAGNTITRNNITSNGGIINLKDAGEGNKIYLNDFVDNTAGVTYSGTPPTTTYWNSTEQIEYVYGGTTYTNYLGNNWSDYTGTDADGDGIGDTSYTVPDGLGEDYRPLMAGYENYPAPAGGICGDVNEDTSVDFIDVGLVGRHKLYGDALADTWAADVNGDDSIDFIDVGLIGRHKLYGDALCCK